MSYVLSTLRWALVPVTLGLSLKMIKNQGPKREISRKRKVLAKQAKEIAKGIDDKTFVGVVSVMTKHRDGTDNVPVAKVLFPFLTEEVCTYLDSREGHAFVRMYVDKTALLHVRDVVMSGAHPDVVKDLHNISAAIRSPGSDSGWYNCRWSADPFEVDGFPTDATVEDVRRNSHMGNHPDGFNTGVMDFKSALEKVSGGGNEDF